MAKSRLIIVGGFLGAGKTTLLSRAARILVERGYRVGLVTNDQGAHLVDTTLLERQGFSVTEVTGSCFCCAFPDLLSALTRLQEQIQPDIIIAEPVGSCTDLVSTVLRPLIAYYPRQFEVAPLSVVVDATRDPRALSPNVAYLFERQIEEAEIVLLNKLDLVTDANLQQFDALRSLSHQTRSLNISARTGEGINTWLDEVLGRVGSHSHSMQVDYERYGQAEAELTWLNLQGIIRASKPFLPRQWMAQMLDTLTGLLQGAPIAHLKVHVTTGHGDFKASVTHNGETPTWDADGAATATEALDFIVNARVSVDPTVLQGSALRSIEVNRPDPLSRYYLNHLECFRPLPPRPSHRMTDEPREAR